MNKFKLTIVFLLLVLASSVFAVPVNVTYTETSTGPSITYTLVQQENATYPTATPALSRWFMQLYKDGGDNTISPLNTDGTPGGDDVLAVTNGGYTTVNGIGGLNFSASGRYSPSAISVNTTAVANQNTFSGDKIFIRYFNATTIALATKSFTFSALATLPASVTSVPIVPTYGWGPWVAFRATETVPNPAVIGAPALNAIDLAYAGQTLSWTSGGRSNPTGYDVYFGSVTPPTAQVSSNQAGLTYATGALLPSTDYYWMIVPRNGTGPAINCPIWKFTTRAEQNPGVATTPVPANHATVQTTVYPYNQTISWTAPAGLPVPTGYKVYIGTTSPPSNIVNGTPQTELSKTFSVTAAGTYYWKILPYYEDLGTKSVTLGKAIPATLTRSTTNNAKGDASGSVIWDFVSEFSGSSGSDYFRTVATGNWSALSTWESSSNNSTWIAASAFPTASATMVYLNHNVTLTQNHACGDITFNAGGAVTFGNFDLTINGTITGTPVFFYTGTGNSSNEGNNSNTDVTTDLPTSIPAVLNTLDIDFGGTVVLPNDVVFTTLTFTNGGLDLNGNSLSAAGKGFVIESADAVLSGLTLAFAPTQSTWTNYPGHTSHSINARWTTTGAFTNTIDITFIYLKTESSAPFMRVWYRNQGSSDYWRNWGAVQPAQFPAFEYDATHMYVTITGVPVAMFNSSAKGPLDWTLSDTDQMLPVELSSFTAVLTSQLFVNLTWVTQSETQVSGYYVFRSNDNNFSNAVCLNSANIVSATNTSDQHSYSLTDTEDLTTGQTYYYWLQSVEMGGGSNLFSPISATITGQPTTPDLPEVSLMSSAYPNPFQMGNTTNIKVNIRAGENGKVTIYNLLGQTVKTFNVKQGEHNLTWNAKGCASGIYFYKLSTPTTNSTKKLVIINQ